MVTRMPAGAHLFTGKDTWKNDAVFDDRILDYLTDDMSKPTWSIVVFKRPEDIEAWYYCGGCGVRSSWERGWDANDLCVQCGREGPAQPMDCNFFIDCEASHGEGPDECSHKGCTFTDCCMEVRDSGACICGRPAHLVECKREAKDWYENPRMGIPFLSEYD